MKIKYTTISLFLILFLTSCEKWFWQHDKLHLEKRDYDGTELRIDGYYYDEYGSDVKYLGAIFFYQNGVILNGGAFEKNRVEEVENYYKNNPLYDSRWSWGLFNTDSCTIKFERWYPSEFINPAYISEGEILNDTTFVITKQYRIKREVEKELRVLNDTFHFKQFSPKPDSTNNFIK